MLLTVLMAVSAVTALYWVLFDPVTDRVIAEARKLKRENKCLKEMLRPIVKADRYSCDCASEWSALCRSLVDEAQSAWSRLGAKMIDEGKDTYTLEDE